MNTTLQASPLDKRIQILAYVLGAAHVVFGGTKLAALAPLIAQFQAFASAQGRLVFSGPVPTTQGENP